MRDGGLSGGVGLKVLVGLAVLACIAVAMRPLAAFADSHYWDAGGSTDANWSKATNWVGDVVPAAGDNAYIGSTSGGGVTPAAATISSTTANCSALYLGYDQDANGSVGLYSGGVLKATSLVSIGYSGMGTFTQSDGNLSTNNLSLGDKAGSTGTYTLNGPGVLTEANEVCIGAYGTGTFTQSDGNNTIGGILRLGFDASASGTYSLTGPGRLVESRAYVGHSGTGAFTQSDGNHTVLGSMYIGCSSGSHGTYDLSSTGRLVDANAYIGYSGSGTFTQSDGNHSIRGALYLGYTSSGIGTYSLNGPGRLVATNEYIGNAGSGTFSQTDGNNTVSGMLYIGYGLGANGTYSLGGRGNNTVIGSLYLGYASSRGAYNLSGDGCLIDVNAYIGSDGGTGTFTQTGGTHTVVETMYVGRYSNSSGTYTLSGNGTLTIGSGGSIRIGADSGTGRFEWFRSGGLTTPTMTLGSKGTLAMGYSFDMASLLNGSLFNGSALTGMGASTLEITNGATATQSSGSASVTNLMVGTSSGDGAYNLIDANNTVSGSMYLGTTSGSHGTYSLSSMGRLVDGNTYIGYSGSGTFTQSDGNHSVRGNLYLGYASGSVGTYDLDETAFLVAANAYVGYSGKGTFTQSDGNSKITAQLALGYNSGAEGSYVLSGRGRVVVDDGECVGSSGKGTFIQHGGDNSIRYSLVVGSKAGSNGTYVLDGPGRLMASSTQSLFECIGCHGTGTFTQTDGDNLVTGNLTLGDASGSSGTYNLSGSGRLSVSSYEYIGDSGIGTFNHSDGNNTGNLKLGRNQGSNGTYNLSGHGRVSASFEYIGDGGTGTFNHSDGNNTVSGKLYIGYSSGVGTYNLNGPGRLVATNEYVGVFGTGTFTQSDGSNTVSGTLMLDMNWGNSLYSLVGGELAVGTLTIGSTTLTPESNAIFSWTGGTFGAESINVRRWGILDLGGHTTTTGAVTVVRGGTIANGTINATSFTVEAGTIDACLAGEANLTKTTRDMFTLSAPNSYRGITTVVDGVLNVTGSLANNDSGHVFVKDWPSSKIAIRRTVLVGYTYTNMGSSELDGLGSAADILAGTNSSGSDSTIQMSWRLRNYNETYPHETSPPIQWNVLGLASDIIDISGMSNDGVTSQTDAFVLQMSYDPASLAVMTGTDEQTLALAEKIYLAWLDPSDGWWKNSVLGNYGGQDRFAGIGAWSDTGDSGLSDDLGRWGVNTANHTVWAVLNHNSQFAVTPEPVSAATLAIGGLLLLRRRKKHA